jgi:hypothetical protein
MIRVYLESKDEKLVEVTLDEFLKKTKSFVGGKVNKSEAIKLLGSTFKQIYDGFKEKNKVYTVVMETKPAEEVNNYKTDYAALDLLQQFIIFYANQLGDILCQKALNNSYIRATGNYATTDINLYGMKKGDNSIIIKSFIFGTTPTTEELYVPTTCGTGGTNILFQKLKQLITDNSFYEKEYNKIKYIHLDSIEREGTINFYSKLGFYKTNKETKRILLDMIKNIYKKDLLFEEYIRKSDLNIGGSLYWSPDYKVLKKLKLAYEYTPELWYKNIFKFKKDGVGQKEAVNHFFSKYEELKGAGIPDIPVEGKRKDRKEGYDLHAVVIHKPVSLEEAFTESKKFINQDRNFHRETQKSFRFRNIPKQKFEKSSFRSKKVNPNVTLIYGKLK